jgi:hypothetical protein
MAAPTLQHGALRHGTSVVLAVLDGGQGLEFDASATVRSDKGGGCE